MNSRKICNNNDARILKEIGSEERFLKIGRLHGVHWPQGIVTRFNPYFLLKQQLSKNTSDSYLQIMNDLIEIVKAKDFSNIIIYGAGEVGKALHKAAGINDVQVECIIDRKESLWGNFISDTEILSLHTSIGKFLDIPFVVGSFEFIEQIEYSIITKAKELNLNPIIFSIKDL